MIARCEEMSQGFGLCSPPDTVMGRRHVQRAPLACGLRRLMLEEVKQRTHERPPAPTGAPPKSLAAQFGEHCRRIIVPSRNLRRESDLTEDRQPAQHLLNPLGRGTNDLLRQITMESLPRVRQLSHRG